MVQTPHDRGSEAHNEKQNARWHSYLFDGLGFVINFVLVAVICWFYGLSTVMTIVLAFLASVLMWGFVVFFRTSSLFK